MKPKYSYKELFPKDDNSGMRHLKCPICDCINLVPLSYKGGTLSCGSCAQIIAMPRKDKLLDFNNKVDEFREYLRVNDACAVIISTADVFQCASDRDLQKPSIEEAGEVIRRFDKYYSYETDYETIGYILREVLNERS